MKKAITCLLLMGFVHLMCGQYIFTETFSPDPFAAGTATNTLELRNADDPPADCMQGL